MNEDIDSMKASQDDIKWMEHTLRLATDSMDPSTQNAACILDASKQNLRGWAINAMTGKPSPERWERPLKYQYVEHAERNAIYDAAGLGVALKDSVMYVPFSPCVECARAIILSRVKCVITHSKISEITPEHWKESLKTASELLRECGVEVLTMEFPTYNVGIRFNGENIIL